ncbi:hypothetical protein SAMN05421736_11955 [Evansella caseinilytica]|uniref:Cof-type HAD-IIB family hydrolase n=1 Tax=Evansella caseinilytica TaxID=1503961 RepID=A0A1H3UA44_9BACI|nr:Cof-type HAD-IIB family hydrolase [Evansella caseinilytica]SDZ58695.1 hypothetical protein SAMN05421736_11955 [Evansella caseinilytica]
MVKLIAVDLDGTLLNVNCRISEKNLESIRRAQSHGVEVVIATGRAHFDVKDIFKNTGIQTWIIGANGATIHKPSGERFHSVPLNREEALTAVNWLEKEEFYYEVFADHAIFSPHHGRELLDSEISKIKSRYPDIEPGVLEESAAKQFQQTGYSYIESSLELAAADTAFYNILAFSFDKEKLEKGRLTFMGNKKLTVVSSGDHNFELEHRNASKGNALKIVADHFKIRMADTAAVGDSFNDLSMLQIVGKSAAMGNAHPEIKAACHEVTQSNSEDGVAHFISSLLSYRQKTETTVS